jgi:hypothetical protein
MTEKEKELKSFNQCADALNALEKRSIMKVFHMLSIHFEIVDNIVNGTTSTNLSNENFDDKSETHKTLDLPKKVSKQQSPKGDSSGLKKSKSSSSKEPKYLTDFDFKPSGQKSLKEYYNEFLAKTNYDRNLIFLYYLQEILKINDITIDHIYSCYREVGLKIPSFPQTLIDTTANKGWITTANTSDLKVTRAGINYIQHDMPKNDK